MLKPKKSLGQNFLVDRNVVRDLVEAAEPARSDLVLEVGAGTGIVTQELARQAGKVLAVEFDRDLIPVLQKNLKSFDNIEIINKDILKLQIDDLRGASCELPNFKIVGSIPYQITSPLIHKLLTTNNQQLTTIALLIQKEVAEKIDAKPPKATYLSNFVQAFAKVELVKNVSKKAFRPRPNVEGAIIKATRDGNIPIYRYIEPQEWSSFLHYGFLHPRKMLKNTFPEEKLKEAGINPQARAQELTVAEWSRLFKIKV